MTDRADLLTTIRAHLFTAVIGDVLDVAGYTHQFLPPNIRALNDTHVLAGTAMPVLEADCAGEVQGHDGKANAFGLMFRALDSLRPDDVYVTTGASPRYALWGGLMSTRAKTLGAAGAVLDGYHRDTREIRALGLPVFSYGAYAQDQKLRGRVIDFNCPIEFGNAARVSPGDVIVGDVDGVVIIPKAVAAEVVAAALTKVGGESDVREAITRGESTQSIFDRTGIM